MTTNATNPVGERVNRAVDTVTKLTDKVTDWALDRGPGVLATLLLLVLAWVLANWAKRVVIKALTRAHIDLTLSKFFGNLTKWGIIVFACVACLGTFGVNTTSFAAVIGAAGLAVGLALQGNLGNLAAGVLLLIFRPFKIGDSVVIGGQTGVIDGIDLFTTNLDTADNRRIVVPNNSIVTGIIENQSRHPERRVDLVVPISPAADLEKTRAVLNGAVERALATPGALRTPAPVIELNDLQPNSMWIVHAWALTPQHGAVRRALLREIKLAVDAAGLAPGPSVMEVRIKEMPKA